MEAIHAKVRWSWGPDGFFWARDCEYPWLKNKAIVYLAPGQNHPTRKGPLITQPEKGPTVVPRSNEKLLPSLPSTLKKQQMAKQMAKQQQKAEQRQKVEQRQKAKQQKKDRRKKR